MEESGDLGVEVYRAIVDACPSAVLLTDPDSRIVLLNETAARMFGYAADELVGVLLDDTLLPLRLRARRRVWRTRYRELPPDRPMLLERVESRGLHRSGEEFPTEMHVSTVHVDGEPMVLAYVEDVTVRRQLAAEARAVSDDLVASVSHELRTPLTSIIGYAELLADEVETRVEDAELRAELVRMLTIVQRNAARERSLVEDLLTTASAAGTTTPVAASPVDLDALVRRVVEDHLPAAGAVGVDLVVSGDDRVRPVPGDPFRLHAVVDNLVGNAVKFTDAGGRVAVSLHHGGRLASIEVADTGCGIAASELPRIFDRLYRSPRAVTEQKPGAGLGLPIVKQVVEAHDGHISIRSEPGRGTLVQVDLPYAETGPSGHSPDG